MLDAGKMYVIPKGVRHRPVVKEGIVELMMIEKVGTVNTGDQVGSERTVGVEDVRGLKEKRCGSPLGYSKEVDTEDIDVHSPRKSDIAK